MLTSALPGLVVGLILGLTGAGGGILAVPLLVFGTGIGVAEAAPVGLLAVGMAAALGAVLGLKAGVVRYRAALLVAAAGMLLAPAGLQAARLVDGRWLGLLFAATLLYVAARTWRQAAGKVPTQDARLPACVRRPRTGRFAWTRPCARALALSGAAAGFLSGLLGVGGGFVMVPALQRFTDLPMKAAVATSLAVIAIISAGGVATAAMHGAIDWGRATPFAAGTLAGMLGGRALAARLAGPALQKAFAFVSALVAIGMVVKALS